MPKFTSSVGYLSFPLKLYTLLHSIKKLSQYIVTSLPLLQHFQEREPLVSLLHAFISETRQLLSVCTQFSSLILKSTAMSLLHRA